MYLEDLGEFFSCEVVVRSISNNKVLLVSFFKSYGCVYNRES